MAKKKTQVSQLFKDLHNEIVSNLNVATYIPDIITFCESPDWLALPLHPTNPINPYPMQRIILKAFYRGSVGNENLTLTDEEIQKCKDLGLVDDDKGDVLGKYNSGALFRELVLVWGRRSGKDFLVSIIALYEAMKLLECPGGDPYSMYEISSANSINILTIANSQEQAKIAFREIREKLLYSPYFKNKFTSDGVGGSWIYLLTPKDKQDNINFKAQGLPTTKGSVAVIVGHSNSESLLGMGCIVLILDEVASYKNTGGASSADRIYTGLTPTVSTYCRRIYEKDDDGKIIVDPITGQRVVKQRIYDGKILSISTPRAKEGKFYELYSTAAAQADRLVCRLPTWEVNITHNRDSLRESQATMSETEFNMEFGAEFSGIGSEYFFTEKQVESCFKDHPFELREIGEPGRLYFCHIDPATTSHNYGLVILHREHFIDPKTNKTDFIIVVDHVKFWHPSAGKPINEDEVHEYIVALKRRFHIVMLTYDAWNSQKGIEALTKNGIPNKMTRFSKYFKMQIYKELENSVNADRLKIPYHQYLRLEMLDLQRKFDATGFKVFPKKDGDGVKTDDLVDCLAGAVYQAFNQIANRLPTGKLIEFGNSSVNQITWMSAQGVPYGVGTGQQITRQLERRASWPNWKRFSR